ncbi:acyltransferase [Loktanella sp. S4079]|uniref:acyltransferase n=1 Tax=Loktanella sp. S4079 TaxID=579483 RepID=UPI0005FA2C7C|nr:acyltransferase [Loktanella sp. S4079]KJZ20668.1 acetyltransferase [Loktanella sp. S4079]
MRYNPISLSYWIARAVAGVLRRTGRVWATQIHRATLKSVGAGCVFQPGVRFGRPDQTTIGDHCYFWRGCDASSERSDGYLQIGDGVQINMNTHLDMTGGLSLGDGVMISQDVLVYTHDHGLDPRSVPQPIGKEIATGAWIGARAVIMPSCRRIGTGAVIGAGAIVTKDVPDRAIVAGNPARIVRMRDGNSAK